MRLRVHVMLRENANEEATGHVHEERPEGKRRAAHSLSGAANQIAKDASRRAAKGNPEKHRGKLMRHCALRAGPGLAMKNSMPVRDDGCIA
jgi:hypothetical protein